MKRKTSHVEARRNFAPYEGPTPTKGTYRGKINKLVVEKANSGNLMYFAVVELEARAGNNRAAEYDGYPAMGRIVLTDKEANLSREQALYLAVSGKEDADVRTETDVAKFKNGDRQQSKVLKINGKDPLGVYVLVELVENEYEGETRMQLDTIYPTRDQNAGTQVAGQTKPVKEPEPDDDVDDEETAEEYEEDELKALGLPALRKILVDEFEYSAEDAAALKTKAKLVGEILDAQTDARGEDEDDETDDEEVDEDEADGDEEEADDEDREAEIREEVEALSRNQVKAALKKYKVHADRVFKKTESDDALQEELIQMRLQDPPF